jgi:ribosomal protein S12
MQPLPGSSPNSTAQWAMQAAVQTAQHSGPCTRMCSQTAIQTAQRSGRCTRMCSQTGNDPNSTAQRAMHENAMPQRRQRSKQHSAAGDARERVPKPATIQTAQRSGQCTRQRSQTGNDPNSTAQLAMPHQWMVGPAHPLRKESPPAALGCRQRSLPSVVPACCALLCCSRCLPMSPPPHC